MRAKFIMVVTATMALHFSGQVMADPIISVKPGKCVSLRKGQTCFQRLRVSFRLDDPGNYCLFANTQVEPLRCFKEAKEGVIPYAFESKKPIEFTLRDARSKILASSVVKVAWVYQKKSRTRNRWRLF